MAAAKYMTSKKILILSAVILIVINASILGTLYATGILGAEEPEPEPVGNPNIAAVPEQTPLSSFKSKAKHVRTIGEAISICEKRLNSSVKEQKSWSVDAVESRYNSSEELYKIFLEYQTIARLNKPAVAFNVFCEVDPSSKAITTWKPMVKS